MSAMDGASLLLLHICGKIIAEVFPALGFSREQKSTGKYFSVQYSAGSSPS